MKYWESTGRGARLSGKSLPAGNETVGAFVKTRGDRAAEAGTLEFPQPRGCSDFAAFCVFAVKEISSLRRDVSSIGKTYQPVIPAGTTDLRMGRIARMDASFRAFRVFRGSLFPSFAGLSRRTEVRGPGWSEMRLNQGLNSTR